MDRSPRGPEVGGAHPPYEVKPSTHKFTQEKAHALAALSKELDAPSLERKQENQKIVAASDSKLTWEKAIDVSLVSARIPELPRHSIQILNCRTELLGLS
jgi:hypothetical protein